MGKSNKFEWTDEQEKFLDLNKNGKFVVKACPGSGKTTAVSERVYRFIQSWDEKKSGIAVLSFTNVAADEIKDNCKKEHDFEIQYPHFVGTLDSFINRYLFLPYGQLVMGCNNRPTFVGAPFNHWVAEESPEKYFTRITFGLNELSYPKGWDRDKKIDKMKYELTKKGFSTQKDAIFHAMKVLEKYPKIAQALTIRFPHVIIDEAQDTTDVHMRIFDLLIENGLKNIVLVGDPEQALYEWNGAKPDLFNRKYDEWEDDSIIFKTNFRSSQKICDFFSTMSNIESIESKCSHDVNLKPKIVPYFKKNYKLIIDEFLDYCKVNGITPINDEISVLFRGVAEVNNLKKTFNKSHIFNIFKGGLMHDKSFTLNIMEGIFLWNNKEFLKAFKKIEKEYIMSSYNIPYFRQEYLNQEINKVGFQKHRTNVYNFIKQFPSIENSQKIHSWIQQVNENFKNVNLCEITDEYIDLTFELLFNGSLTDDGLKYNIGTVHSVKGDSFDAVLLILKNKANRDDFYVDLIDCNNYLSEEELRIVYVALSRPKKILQVAVPNNDYEHWKSLFHDS